MKQEWRRLAVIGILGVLVQTLWALRLTGPAYMDAAYYATNGMRLAGGHGFTELVIWQYLDHPPGFPNPSHTYWMPLASLLTAAGYLLWPTFRGMQLPFVLLAGLLPLLSYAIAHTLGGDRRQCLLAALWTMAGGYFAAVWVQPETFAPFAWTAGGALLLLGRADRRSWLAAGGLAGLAYLTRGDGLLVAVSGLLVGADRLWRRREIATAVAHSHLLRVFLLGFLLVATPWLLRTLRHPSPALQTAFLTTYDDLFAYGRGLDVASFLDWGLVGIVRSRLMGVSLAVQTLLAVGGLIFLTPLSVWGWGRLWRSDKRPYLLPLTVYTGLLLIAMSLVFPFPGSRGGLFHAMAALWPWMMALAAFGLDAAIDWTAARRSNWRPAQARRVFGTAAVVMAFALSAWLGLARGRRAADPAVYARVEALLPATAVVMAGDAPMVHYHTGLPALSVPNEVPDRVLDAARRYGATHLLLDQNRPLPLDALYRSGSAPGFELIETLDGVQLYRLEPDAAR